MKKSELLKAAIPTLWNGIDVPFKRSGEYEYVCFAIEAAGDRLRVQASFYSKEQADAVLETRNFLMNWVQTTLLGFDRCAGLEDWIEQHHPEKHDEYVHNNEKLQRLRKRWMQWMIRYWEAKGE